MTGLWIFVPVAWSAFHLWLYSGVVDNSEEGEDYHIEAGAFWVVGMLMILLARFLP